MCALQTCCNLVQNKVQIKVSYEKKNLKTLQSNCCFALEYWSGLVLLFLWDNDNILVGRC